MSGRGAHAFRAEQGHDLLTEHAVSLKRAVKILRFALFRDQRRKYACQFFFVVDSGAGDTAAHGDDCFIAESLKQIIEGDLHILIFILDARLPVDLFLFWFFPRDAASVLSGLRGTRGVCRVNQIADPLPCIYQFLCFEFVICFCDGVAVYAQLLRHQTFRWQHAARRAFAG